MSMIHVLFVNIKILIKLQISSMKIFVICDGFVDNKLSTHFGEDKTKSILLASKIKNKSIKKLHIK